MSEMQVSMRLTLENLASTPLATFADQLKRLEPVIASLNAKFATFGRSAKVMGDGAAAGSVGVTKLETAMGALGAKLVALDARLAASVESFTALGTIARAASADVVLATSRVGRAGEEVKNTTNHVLGLNSALKDMAKLWAAFEIGRGIKSSIHAATDYQSTQTRLANLNLPNGGAQGITRAANSASQQVKTLNREQTLAIGIDLVNATGSVAHAVSMMKPFAEAIYNMNRALPTGQRFTDKDTLMLAKALEQRGVTMDPAKMQNELDMFSKIVAATQGRVGPRQLLGNINYAKGGMGLTMDTSFMPIFSALIERVMSGGGGGNAGQVGTALTSMQQAIVGGVLKQSALPEWSSMGLLDPSKVIFNSVGSLKGVQAGGVAGASLFMRDPYQWVQQYLVPALKKSGIDTTDPTKVNEVLAHMFGNRNAANIAGIMATQQPLLEKDAGIINRTRNNAGQYAANMQTAQANFDKFHAALGNLAIAIGNSVLPQVTAFVNGVAALVNDLRAFAEKFPTLTKYLTDLIAAFGLLLAGSVFVNFVGSLKWVSSALKGAGGVIVGFIKMSYSAAAEWTARLGEVFAAQELTVGGILSAIAQSIITKISLFLGLFLHSSSLNSGEDAQMAKIKALPNPYIDFGVDSKGGWGGDTPGTASIPALSSAVPGAGLFPSFKLSPTGPAGRVAHHIARIRSAAKPKADTAWSSQVTQAVNAVKGFSQKDSAVGIRKKWDHYKAVLAMSGQDGLAQLAGQHGEQLANAFDLKEAKDHLSGLQADLANETKLNAAKVTAGVFTQDQGQQATLTAQKNAAPGLLAAAQAVRQLELAAGKSTAAIDTAIVTINALGNALTQFQQKLKNGIEGSFAGLFSNIMHGKQSFRSDMAQFITGLSNTFISTLSSSMADGLVKGLFSPGSPLGNLLKGMGSGSGVMTSIGSGLSSMAGSAYSWLSSFAVGADNIPNDMVANIHKGEMIIPAKGAEAIRSGKLGGSSFNGDVNVVVNHDGTSAIGGANMSSAHQMFGQMVGEHVRQIILQEQRPGGLLGA
jgi:hypothetical protein